MQARSQPKISRVYCNHTLQTQFWIERVEKGQRQPSCTVHLSSATSPLMYRLNLKFNFCLAASAVWNAIHLSHCHCGPIYLLILCNRTAVSLAYRVEKGLKLHFFTPLHKLWRFPFHASSNGIVIHFGDSFAFWNYFPNRCSWYCGKVLLFHKQRFLFVVRKETTSPALQPIALRRLSLFTLIKLYYR